MISYLKGQVLWKNKDSLALEVNNLGYEIFTPKPGLEKIKVGEEAIFYTHEYLRENSRELYGFLTRDELGLFFELIKVGGVGPKTALNVMSLGAAKIKDAIAKGDVDLISTIPGVGKKTSQKIILELRGVLAETGLALEETEALDALRSLGYSQGEAIGALRKIGESAGSAEEKIRGALKILGKK